MNLVVMRHGDAGSHHFDDPEEDRERPLTPEGREMVPRVAQGLQKLGIAPSLIVCSPFRRTLETAALVAAVLTPAQLPTPLDGLIEHAELSDVVDALKTQPDKVLVVTHHDVLERFAAYIVDGKQDTDVISLPPASAVGFDTLVDGIDAAVGHITWAIQAEQLALLAETRPGTVYSTTKLIAQHKSFELLG